MLHAKLQKCCIQQLYLYFLVKHTAQAQQPEDKKIFATPLYPHCFLLTHLLFTQSLSVFAKS